MDYKLYSIKGSESSKKLKLNKDVFGIEPNEHCIYLAVKSELASLRQGTSSSKTRAEVSGVEQSHGGKKVLVELGLDQHEIHPEFMVEQLLGQSLGNII